MNARSLVLLVLVSSLAIWGARGEDGIQKGAVIESVATKADPNQTYALFLPPEYRPRPELAHLDLLRSERPRAAGG